MQFHYRLIVHQKSSNYSRKLYNFFMILDRILNDNEITCNRRIVLGHDIYNWQSNELD
jgi:hypothetical protein